jgi:hypothetical protein
VTKGYAAQLPGTPPRNLSGLLQLHETNNTPSWLLAWWCSGVADQRPQYFFYGSGDEAFVSAQSEEKAKLEAFYQQHMQPAQGRYFLYN